MTEAWDSGFVADCREKLENLSLFSATGFVCSLAGSVIEGEGLPAEIGSLCLVDRDGDREPLEAQVIAFRDERFLMLPLAEPVGVRPGARLRLGHRQSVVPCGEACLGRVLDGVGRPIDGGGDLDSEWVSLSGKSEPSLARQRVSQPLDLGVRAINGFVTAGLGARLGIFAGSGVGKSTLLGQIARNTTADVVVVGLVGERAREVREFVERDLGDALARSVVVVATSSEAPLLRVRAAHAATAIAERFRDEGRHVLLLMDSVTRFCTALREIGLAAGEPPTTRGYPPSVWGALPSLLERAGTSVGGGSITGIYTVLVEGDDPNEPVSDATRAILDGHIVLTRELAERGHHPAIDVLASVSRVMPDVTSAEHVAVAARGRDALATFRRAEDLISIGAYVEGSDPRIDAARRLDAPLRHFLRQSGHESTTLAESVDALGKILGAEAA